MPADRGYDIFPRTFKARVLLALAFLGGLGMIALSLVPAVLLFMGLLERPPCSGSARESCLQAQVELAPIAQSSCEGVGRRVCLVPLGQTDPDLVQELVDYYREVYGLDIGVLTPTAIPAEMLDPERRQIASESLADSLATSFPDDYYDPDVVLIGLTPLDLYTKGRDWRFAFGHAEWGAESRAVVSTYRMHVGTFGLVDHERVVERTRKMMTKYLGLMYYGLPLSDEPTSPLFNRILSVYDLDRMEEPLSAADR